MVTSNNEQWEQVKRDALQYGKGYVKVQQNPTAWNPEDYITQVTNGTNEVINTSSSQSATDAVAKYAVAKYLEEYVKRNTPKKVPPKNGAVLEKMAKEKVTNEDALRKMAEKAGIEVKPKIEWAKEIEKRKGITIMKYATVGSGYAQAVNHYGSGIVGQGQNNAKLTGLTSF